MSGTVTFPSPTAYAAFQFLAPEFATLPQTQQAAALTFAETYRPKCLPLAKQDEAVALYAAWLLGLQAGGYGNGTGTSTDPSRVSSEKEGDLAHTMFSLKDLGLTAADVGNYKARFDRLYRICAIGSLITRYG